MRVPEGLRISLEVVSQGLDEADDWIVENADSHDIVVTSDIPLAARCLKLGTRVVGPNGRLFTEDNIGDAVATRDLLADLRSGGERTGGPPPLGKRDRSRFLQQLDGAILSIRRQSPVGSTDATP